MESTAPAAKTNGLSTVINTIAAPSDAFETLRVAPTWGWACLIAIALLSIGTFLQAPAAQHVQVIQMQKMLSTSSFAANIPAERKQKMLADAQHPSAVGRITSVIGPVIVLFIAVFFNTLIMLIGNAVGKGRADFKRLWAGSMNIAVPTLGLGGIVIGIIVMMRSPESFNSILDLFKSIPSLAWLMPNASAPMVAFGASISVFSLWGLFLNASMLRSTAKTSTVIAYTFAAIVTLLGALSFAAYLRMLSGFGMA